VSKIDKFDGTAAAKVPPANKEDPEVRYKKTWIFCEVIEDQSDAITTHIVFLC